MREFNKAYYDTLRQAQAKGEPVSQYIKPIKGKVCVDVLDAFGGTPESIILEGDPADPEIDKEDVIVTCWTEAEDEYFRRANKLLLENGLVAPYDEEIEEEISVNEVTDKELRELLQKPYFAWKTRLDSFTSPVPVKRMLKIAKDLNRPVNTIDTIKEALSELQKKGG
jgi:hypothetical protein